MPLRAMMQELRRVSILGPRILCDKAAEPGAALGWPKNGAWQGKLRMRNPALSLRPRFMRIPGRSLALTGEEE